MSDESTVMFRVLPRLAAIAETGWNADGRTDYDDFVERVITAAPI